MLIESGMAVQVIAVRSGRIIVVPYSQETL